MLGFSRGSSEVCANLACDGGITMMLSDVEETIDMLGRRGKMGLRNSIGQRDIVKEYGCVDGNRGTIIETGDAFGRSSKS